MSPPTELYAAVLVLGGLVLCFKGYELIRIFLPLAGFVVFGAVSAEVARPYAQDTLSILGAAFIGGFLGAALLMAAFFYGIFLLGAAFGWYVGVSLAPLLGAPPGTVAMITTVIGGIVALIAQKPLVAIATAVWGALITYAGIQVWTGTLVVEKLIEPNTLVALVHRGDAALFAVLLLVIAGIAVQLRPERTVVVPIG